MKDYIALTKPRVTWLILATTAIGYYFGARLGWSVWTLFHTIAGTCLIASGTAALNQWYERDADAKMKRTKARPLPSGRIAPAHAFLFALGLVVVGFVELCWGANLLTGLLGLFTVITYLFAYTPMKQRSVHSTTVGAIPGAMPPLIGFAGAAGTLSAEAWILGVILFLWQFPHFYAIAWMYREDYERAGIRMLPVVEPDGESTARRILWCAMALVPVSLLPRFWSMAGNLYVAGATLAGIGFLYYCWRVMQDRTRVRARGVLLASVVYLPILYGLLVIDHTGL
ncbi:MAG: protoheme IX farnesyltransferase [Acidobacteria bacterium]|nr:protoheme IX farnesyltransferase [Acidobacteriota bacterium]